MVSHTPMSSLLYRIPARRPSPERYVGAGYRMDRQNGQGRAETQDAEGADASRLSMQIAVKPEDDSKQGRSTKPKGNVESVHSRKNFSTMASRR